MINTLIMIFTIILSIIFILLCIATLITIYLCVIDDIKERINKHKNKDGKDYERKK